MKKDVGERCVEKDSSNGRGRRGWGGGVVSINVNLTKLSNNNFN